MGCRCFWDSDTDNYAQDIFMNVREFYLELSGKAIKYEL